MNEKINIGITGAGGALGKSLTKKFKSKGFKITGFSHSQFSNSLGDSEPDEWVQWECGKEYLLEDKLKKIDILILNHGVYQSGIDNTNYQNSIEINALSKLRLLNIFEEIAFNDEDDKKKEIWINTSEAEILPAINPSYEISKLLIGQIITFKKNLLTKNQEKKFTIRKIILGPFKSNLNPIGIMTPDLVATLIFQLSKVNTFLIIISPNPLTYIFFPIKEFYFFVYCKLLIVFKFIKI
tara:strand:- start:462 stop:1178 length:717 start_codon:yes stop_codon:yes gene_type:complete